MLIIIMMIMEITITMIVIIIDGEGSSPSEGGALLVRIIFMKLKITNDKNNLS